MSDAPGAAASAMGSGRELANPPSDGISNLRFSNHSDHLLVSSWDKTVRLYDAEANLLKGEFAHPGPVLDCCFHDDSSGFSAGADHTVRRLSFTSSKEDVLGRHDAPVRCVEYSYAAGTCNYILLDCSCVYVFGRTFSGKILMQIDSVKPKVIYCINHIIIKDAVDFLRDQYT
ncbi:mitotic checkpoint protein BUB3.2-like [Triticum urartu]|uniref:Mitotic checkpoint protein BUB3.1 n=1 Tax=Triticum urartu TaxID=4572 RepID=A0A8R7Q591_TRIUA|nr:mitotic checkpoint protein BUB3.2-like [Triticum urartu]